MNENTNSMRWIVGIVIVVLVVLGLWWWSSTTPGAENPGGSATTDETAGTAPPVAVETRATMNVAAVVASIPNGTTFNSLFVSTGVAASLTGKGPYTVFVPTDGAFARLAPGAMPTTAAEKKRLVQYHVVSGRKLDIDAISSGTIQALSKDMLNFQVTLATGATYVNSGYALTAYRASNGIVYTINTVLLPPNKVPVI